MPPQGFHHTHRTSWLRAVVLGANDGITSTASLLVGLASAHASRVSVLIAGVAGVVAGTMSMAAGEYVSVSSQADVEEADLLLERKGLEDDEPAERAELTAIYVSRGLSKELAAEVADQLMASDALGAHARDELGITDTLRARPLQAALASGASFSIGGCIPLIAALLASAPQQRWLVFVTSAVCLALLGGAAARAGGAGVGKGAARVLLWGLLAMGVTAAVGSLLAVVQG
jgi:VIT1/CCC1 family predicted Fe2+/Mn2+ transporter